MKCTTCSRKIETTFMNKIVGTMYTKGKKRYPICGDCQGRFSDKELREKLEI